jgi:hypothetical protein
MAARSECHLPRLRLRALAAVPGCLAVFWLTSACQTSCANNDQQPIKYVDGRTYVRDSTRYYESTPWNGEWLHFPGNRRFLLHTGLGTTDYTNLAMFIAFDSHPINADAGDVAVATGDVAVVERIDADDLQLRNDTCSEQYLYVKIAAPVDVDAGM